MPRPDVLVLVLAGGKGSRLEHLTVDRAKPAVPFAGMYRLIDFPLSNCLHSAVSDVWVLQQYQPASLNDHLANGRPWDLDRTTGGLLVLPPYQGTNRGGWTQGTADGLWRNADLIRQVQPKAVVMVSADAVYQMDYRLVVDDHHASGAALTMVTYEVDPADAGRYGVVEVDGDRVTSYEYKPDEPKSALISNEVFAFDPRFVLDALDDLAAKHEAASDGSDSDDGLGDLGDELWPTLVNDGEVRQYRHDEYWRDVGTIEAYLQANLDFLSDEPPLDLDDEDWPVRSQGGAREAAWIAPKASVNGSLISSAARIHGTVTHSVLSPGVQIEQGAVVENSVLLPGVVVRRGARVVNSVVDDSVEIGADAVVGGDGEIALLGRQARFPSGEQLAPGGRFPEIDDDR